MSNNMGLRYFALFRWGIGLRVFGRWCLLRSHASHPMLFSERYCPDTVVRRIGPLRLTIRPKPR